MASLKNKAVSGIFWSFIQKVGTRGILFVVMILLARILTPKAFGLIGMLSIFIQISQALIDGGFNLALIQKKDTDEEDYSSVFYINLVVSIILYLLLFFGAPFIADFYHQPSLVPLTRVLSIMFVFNAFSYVQEAKLTKEVRFKTLMIIHIPSTIIAGLISVIMAFMGYGVWSLVALQVVMRFLYVVQIWVYAKWKPLLTFNKQKARKLFSFGGKLFISKIITTLYNNIFLVVIGKYFPVQSVGFYQNAYNLAYTPSNTITTVLSGVTFPIFSTIQDDMVRLKMGYKKVMQQAFFWICPLFIFAGVLAKPLFIILFTPKWLGAVPYFQWLCVVAILQPLSTYNLDIVNVLGRSDIFLKLQLIRRIVTIFAIILVFPLGITALLVVQATSSIFTFILFSHYSGKFINYSLKEQMRDILPILMLSLCIGFGLFFINIFLEKVYVNNYIIIATAGFFIACFLYWLMARLFKITAYFDVLSMVREKIDFRRKK